MRKYTTDEVQFIRDNYSVLGPKKVAVALGATLDSIYYQSRRLGIRVDPARKKSRYDKTMSNRRVNTHYFDTTKTYNQGYILGFIYADGSMSSGHLRTSVEINTRDLEVLEFIKSEMCITSNIFHRKNRPTSSIWIPTKEANSKLISLGVHPNKSKTIKFPTFGTSNFIRGFVSGFFDGDGSCSKNTDYFRCNFRSSSVEFLDSLSDLICANLNIPKKRVSIDKNETGSLHFDGSFAIKFCSWLYREGEFHMERKLKLYLEAKDKNVSKVT